jgi:rubrerythrin
MSKMMIHKRSVHAEDYKNAGHNFERGNIKGFRCHTCGYLAKSLGKMNEHRADKHPESYEKASKNAAETRRRKAEEVVRLEMLEQNGRLSGKDMLEAMRVKRDALNEVIATMEKMLK